MALIPEGLVIARGALDGDILGPDEERTTAAVLTQAGAAAIADRVVDGLRDLGLAAPVLELADGEQAKTLQQLEAIYRWLLDHGMTRHDTVVAVGGGTVTDVAGFAAATFNRGVEAVYVPTTLLAAVDGAIGGKTGINLDGKNIVGVVRQPARVIIDIDVMEALPRARVAEGLVEAYKTGLVADAGLAGALAGDPWRPDLEDVVTAAVAAKMRVVASDPEDRTGERAVLNFGHTIGHALEAAAGMGHGRAVALGLIAESHASERVRGFGGRAQVEGFVAALGMAGRARFDRAEARRLLQRDKKRSSRGVAMVLLDDTGVAALATVDDATVEAAFDVIEES